MATRGRSPGVSSIAFGAQPPDLRFAPLMDMDFAIRCPLVRRLRLVSGSCPSAFDRVNHDSLMARVAARVTDKRVLKLIRAFLKAGVMEDGLVSPVDEGTPQGGPLSPLLSNLVLDDLDKGLTRRGHRFCRYADDCNIHVRSRRAGERLMASVNRFLTKKLRLKVNETKSAGEANDRDAGFASPGHRGVDLRCCRAGANRAERRFFPS
jgi:Reverse transcriptase (RNA-dependent DNA polymerase)